jgi:hypothetical protein
LGLLYLPNISVHITPTPPPDADVTFIASPKSLADGGLNFPVAIHPSKHSPAGVDSVGDTPPMVVFAHLDTGASISAIDIGLAKYMKLSPNGMSSIMTAGGACKMPTYVVDLHFPTSTLSPFVKLSIGSAMLGFNVAGDHGYPRNFGLLIGRDVMSRWSFFWNGPASSVTIND